MRPTLYSKFAVLIIFLNKKCMRITLFIKLRVSVCPKPSNSAMMSDTTCPLVFVLMLPLMPIFPGIFTVATLSDSLSNSGYLFSFCHQLTSNFLSMHWDCLSN
jgi:hypothetical protein